MSWFEWFLVLFGAYLLSLFTIVAFVRAATKARYADPRPGYIVTKQRRR